MENIVLKVLRAKEGLHISMTTEHIQQANVGREIRCKDPEQVT